MKLYDALADSKIKPILTRHEQVASIMAEVYGRLTGKPGVFTSQGAWTITNGMMGALEGNQGSSPMLMLTDMTDNAPYSHHGSYQVGTGEYGGYDVKKVVEAATKYSTVVHNPEQAVQSKVFNLHLNMQQLEILDLQLLCFIVLPLMEQ